MTSIRKHLSWQFNLILAGVFLVGTVIIGTFTWNISTRSAEEGMASSLDGQIAALSTALDAIHSEATQRLPRILAALEESAPAPYVVSATEKLQLGEQSAPVLRAGGLALTGNNRPCDLVLNYAGALCSTFVRNGDDFIRISSTVKKPDGSRAVGTLMDHQSPAYKAAMSGDDYLGITRVAGNTIMALYHPVKNADNQVVGILSVGFDLSSQLASFKSRIASLKVGDTGYFYIIDANEGKTQGNFILHPALEGKNGKGITDANGLPLFDKMLEMKNGTLSYSWKKDADSPALDKVAVFRQVSSWGWLIAGGSYVSELTQSSRRIVSTQMAGLVIQALLLIALIAWLFAHLVSRPISTAQAAIAAIADGDLSRPVNTTREDEIGQMLRSIESMRGNLSAMIAQVRQAAGEFKQRSATLLTTATRSSSSSMEQSSSATGIASSIEQLHTSLSVVDENTRIVQQFAGEAGERAKQGSHVISQVSSEMTAINRQVSESAKVVEALTHEADNIGSIVDVIKGVADQTNLLALNAAIEAARAGESGRGFAVVADEVRKLAEQTSRSTEQIATVVTGIQAHSGRAGAAMEQVSRQVDQGMQLAGDAQTLIASISDSATDLTHRLDSIALSLREQNAAGTDISRRVEQVASLSEETADDARRVTQEAHNMETLSTNLNSVVERFRL